MVFDHLFARDTITPASVKAKVVVGHTPATRSGRTTDALACLGPSAFAIGARDYSCATTLFAAIWASFTDVTGMCVSFAPWHVSRSVFVGRGVVYGQHGLRTMGCFGVFFFISESLRFEFAGLAL